MQKLRGFLAAIQGELYSLAILGVLSSVIASFYYIRIIRLSFFSTDNAYLVYNEVGRWNSLIFSGALIFLIFFFVYPHPFLMTFHKITLLLSL